MPTVRTARFSAREQPSDRDIRIIFDPDTLPHITFDNSLMLRNLARPPDSLLAQNRPNERLIVYVPIRADRNALQELVDLLVTHLLAELGEDVAELWVFVSEGSLIS